MTTPVMSVPRTTLLSTILVAIGPLSMSLYTPAMTLLVEAFGSTEAIVKMTLAVYFGGFAVSQLVAGPAADALGRRRSTIIFMGVYIAGSIACALAPTIEILIAGRLVQGIGAAIGVTVSRAIVRDLYPGERGARILNLVGISMASAPAFAPTIGGLMTEHTGWHSIFLLMVGFGLAIELAAIFLLKETTRPDMSRLRPRRIMQSYATLLTNAEFVSAAMAIAAGIGVFYAQAPLLPFVMMDRVGLTSTEFGFSMLFQSGTFMLGSLSMRILLKWWNPGQLAVPGLSLIAAGGVAIAFAPHLFGASLLTIMLPVAISAFGAALMMPYMLMAGMRPFPQIAGQAAAMTGFLQMSAGLAGGSIGALFDDPVVAMSTVIPAMAAISAVSYLFYRRAAASAMRQEAELEAEAAAAAITTAPAE